MKPDHTPSTIDNPTDDGFQNSLRGVISDATITAMQARAREKAKAMARTLGPKYVLHTKNSPNRVTPSAGSLDTVDGMLGKVFQMAVARGSYRAKN